MISTMASEELPLEHTHDATFSQERIDLANSLDVEDFIDDPAAQEAVQRFANLGYVNARIIRYAQDDEMHFICREFVNLPASSPPCAVPCSACWSITRAVRA